MLMQVYLNLKCPLPLARNQLNRIIFRRLEKIIQEKGGDAAWGEPYRKTRERNSQLKCFG